jgi:hypothetical protein
LDGHGSTLAWVALSALALAGLVMIPFGTRLTESRDTLHVQARQLDQLARLDALTGVSNRRDLNEMLPAALVNPSGAGAARSFWRYSRTPMQPQRCSSPSRCGARSSSTPRSSTEGP